MLPNDWTVDAILGETDRWLDDWADAKLLARGWVEAEAGTVESPILETGVPVALLVKLLIRGISGVKL